MTGANQILYYMNLNPFKAIIQDDVSILAFLGLEHLKKSNI